MGLGFTISKLLRIWKGQPRPFTTAVVLAAGVGSRMNMAGELTKQLLLLDEKPVLVHSLLAFEECPYIDAIVVVTRREEEPAVREMLGWYPLTKITAVVPGGMTRADSARAGFEAVPPETAYIAIHDAARCLITPEQISDVAASAYANMAATAACRIRDTVKRVNADGYITETLNREELWAAQTPQIFRYELYCAAVENSKKGDRSVTDDNMLVEALGQAIHVVDLGENNFKITVWEDVARAEELLRERRLKKERSTSHE